MRVRSRSAFATLVTLLWSLAAMAKPDLPDPFRQLGFMANEGQADAAITHYAPVANGLLALDDEGRLEYRLAGKQRTTVLRERFLGAHKATPRVEGSGPTLHLYRGGKRLHLATHPRLHLADLWPGIDLTLSHRADTVEKIFRLEPGAEVSRIRLRIEGAQRLALEEDGRLRLDTPAGPTWFSAPSPTKKVHRAVNGWKWPTGWRETPTASAWAATTPPDPSSSIHCWPRLR